MKQRGNFFSKIKTGCAVIVLILVIIYLGLALVQCVHNRSGTPDSKSAPYAIQVTGGRVWFSADGQVVNASGQTLQQFSQIQGAYALKDNEAVVLKNWYDSVDSKKWKLHKGYSPPFNKNAFAQITVKGR
jgi:hypothetical protein